MEALEFVYGVDCDGDPQSLTHRRRLGRELRDDRIVGKRDDIDIVTDEITVHVGIDYGLNAPLPDQVQAVRDVHPHVVAHDRRPPRGFDGAYWLRP